MNTAATGGRLSRMMLAALVAGGASGARTAQAALEPCVNAVKEFTCEPIPESAEARRAVLLQLDSSARAAVAENRRPAAIRFFSCLLLADPRPEHAGNLAVVLKQSGELPAALDAAMCAELLARPDSADAARARARRMEIEHLLSEMRPPPPDPTLVPAAPAAAPATPAPADGPNPVATLATAEVAPTRAPPAPQTMRSGPVEASALRGARTGGESHVPPATVLTLAPSHSTEPPVDASPAPTSARHFRPSFLASVAVAIVGTGIGAVSYLVANSRAEQFGREQTASGFTTRARDLKSGAEAWQVASMGAFVAAGVAGATAVLVW